MQLLHLLEGGRLVGIDEVVEQTIDAADVLRHATAQHIVGIGLVAQQLCYLATEVDEAPADLEVVVLVVVDALGVVGHVHLAAQLTLGAVGHEGRIAGCIEGEHPSLELALTGLLGSSVDGGLGQPVELGGICDVEHEVLVLLQQVLRELQAQQRCLFSEGTQAVLLVLREQGATAYEAFVAVVKEPLLLRRQTAMMAMHILHTLEELLVEAHVVGMLRQDGAHLLCQGVHLVVGLGREEIEEHGRHTVEQVVVALRVVVLVDDGIVESGSCRIIDGFLEVFLVTADALHERLLIVLHTDTVEGRRVVGRAIRLEKRVLPLRFIFSHVAL